MTPALGLGFEAIPYPNVPSIGQAIAGMVRLVFLLAPLASPSWPPAPVCTSGCTSCSVLRLPHMNAPHEARWVRVGDAMPYVATWAYGCAQEASISGPGNLPVRYRGTAFGLGHR